MDLWLTLLLAWTTGLPAAIFLAAGLAVRHQERRAAHLAPLLRRREFRPLLGPACGRREHRHARQRTPTRRPV